MSYEERVYRYYSKSDDLTSFEVKVLQTDLYILADKDLSKEAEKSIIKYRGQIESYITGDDKFVNTLKPYSVDKNAPGIVKDMAVAARKAGVGPMATVAGAISRYVGNDLLKHSRQLIIENGGDVFIKSDKPRKIGLYTGNDKIDKKLVLELAPSEYPRGICASSGKVGHSLSFGRSDTVVILSGDVIIADAVATATGNIVKDISDIKKGIDFARSIEEVTGVLIVMDGHIGIWGEMKLSR